MDVHKEGGSPQIVQTWTGGGRGSKIPKILWTYLMEAPLRAIRCSSYSYYTTSSFRNFNELTHGCGVWQRGIRSRNMILRQNRHATRFRGLTLQRRALVCVCFVSSVRPVYRVGFLSRMAGGWANLPDRMRGLQSGNLKANKGKMINELILTAR